MAEEQAMTWEERTIQRLEAEQAQSQPVEQEAVEATTSEATESEGEADGALSVDETEEEESASEEEITEEDESGGIDWEQQAKDHQAAFTQKAEEVARLSEDVTQMTEEYTRGRYAFDDGAAKAEQAFQFAMNLVNAKANQARNINLSTLPPEQVAQAQQFMQQAALEEQQVKGAYDQFVKQVEELRKTERDRDATVSRRILERQIPDFQDKYPEIMKHMVASGMSQRDAQEVINPAVIRAFYDSMTLKTAPDTVEVTKETKARPPKSRLAPEKPRGVDGRFKKAEQAFRETKHPRQRVDAWEEKTRIRLEKEKGR